MWRFDVSPNPGGFPSGFGVLRGGKIYEGIWIHVDVWKPRGISIHHQSVTTCSRTLLLFQKLAHLFEFILDPVHLFDVPVPDFASFQSLALGHLRGANDFIHKVPQQPNTHESQRHDHDKKRAQFRDTEESLQLITRCDDQEGEVDDDKKRLSEVEAIFLCEELLAPLCESSTKGKMRICAVEVHSILLEECAFATVERGTEHRGADSS